MSWTTVVRLTLMVRLTVARAIVVAALDQMNATLMTPDGVSHL
jgi:hypothetical protein